MQNYIEINFIGGPGAGKSTLAHRLYGWLKSMTLGRNLNFHQEVATQCVANYGKEFLRSPYNQLCITAQELSLRHNVFLQGCNILVTDTSPYLCQFYCHPGIKAAVETLVEFYYQDTASIEIFVEPRKTYTEYSRLQTQTESLILSEKMRTMLKYDISVKSDEQGWADLKAYISKVLEIPNGM